MKIKSYDKVKFFKKELNVSNLDKKGLVNLDIVN